MEQKSLMTSILFLHLSGTICSQAQLCCPKGQAYLPDGDTRTCQDYTGLGTEQEGEEFHCPSGSLMPLEFLHDPGYQTEVATEGDLHISWGVGEEEVYEASHFCLALTDLPDYSMNEEEDDGSASGSGSEPANGFGNESGSWFGDGSVSNSGEELGIIRPTMMVCYEEVDPKLDPIRHRLASVFYPVAIFISDFFFLLTIIVYCLLKNLRKNLFGKLTLGFLINVCFAYFFTGLHNILDLENNEELLNTPFCKVLGYLIQHFFIAFFFWMSAMSFNITWTFTNTLSSRGSSGGHTRLLLTNICYAQGLPLLITVITLCLDSLPSNEASSFVRPGMGKYECFLGSEWVAGSSFIFTPQFLYFYLVEGLIIAANTACFLITGASLIRHWLQVKILDKSFRERLKSQIAVSLKLFIVMGIPWILEVISASLEHSERFESTWELKLVLDIVNLMTGVLIFLALVCKVQVLRGLRMWAGGRQKEPSHKPTGTRGVSLNRSGATVTSTLSSSTVTSGTRNTRDKDNNDGGSVMSMTRTNFKATDDSVSP